MSMSVGSQRRPHSHSSTWSPIEQLARAGVAAQLGDVVEQPALEQDGMAGRAVVGRAHREMAAAVVEHPGDRLRR